MAVCWSRLVLTVPALLEEVLSLSRAPGSRVKQKQIIKLSWKGERK